MRKVASRFTVGFFVLFLMLSGPTAQAVSLPECIMNSQDASNIINSAPCGLYGIINTRQENDSGDNLDVAVQYMVHLAMGAPRGIVVLFNGGNGNTGIVSDGVGGIAQVGNNFLVRSAQLFAEDANLAKTRKCVPGQHQTESIQLQTRHHPEYTDHT